MNNKSSGFFSSDEFTCNTRLCQFGEKVFQILLETLLETYSPENTFSEQAERSYLKRVSLDALKKEGRRPGQEGRGPGQEGRGPGQEGAGHCADRLLGVYVLLVVLVFYGPSTHFMSFRVRSVNLATLFLSKHPRQFTSS